MTVQAGDLLCLQNAEAQRRVLEAINLRGSINGAELVTAGDLLTLQDVGSQARVAAALAPVGTTPGLTEGQVHDTVLNWQNARAEELWLDTLNEFFPVVVGGGVVWLRADVGTQVTGSGVNRWDDLASGTSWLQSTDGQRPPLTVQDPDFSNQSSLTVTPTDQLNLSPPGSLSDASTDWTFLAVHKSATADDSASHVMFDTGETPFGSPNRLGFFWGFGGGNDLGALTGGAAITVPGTTQTTATRYDTWVLDDTANTLEIYEDGVSAGTGSYTAANVLNTTTAGRIGVEVSDIRHYSGKIAELMLFNRVLSSAELSQLWDYIAARYGL